MHVESIHRDAAYTAARSALVAIREASSGWPPEVAKSACKAASDTLTAVAEAFVQDPTSAERRKSLRGALCNALELAAICDIVMAHGMRTTKLEESLRCATRTLSMIGLSIHATAAAAE